MRRLDHVTIAGSRLDPLVNAFTRVGLAPEYGGPHSNGTTHMSALSFADGSYIELISTLPGVERASWWNQPITEGGGPCAWAQEHPDVKAEAARLSALGIPVNGPHHMNRRRPDGQIVEWDLAYLGDAEPGTMLPFIIKDHTPRSLRIAPPSANHERILTGIACVVLAVKDLETSLRLFQRLYNLPDPQIQDDNSFGAKLAYFQGTPVILASPLPTESNWLTGRLDRFGDLPCAFLLGTSDLEKVSKVYPVSGSHHWLGQRVAWFDENALLGTRLGVIDIDTFQVRST